MSIQKELLGMSPEGKQYERYILKDEATGGYIAVLNHGCALQQICVPDREGNLVDVAVGYDTVEEYLGNASDYSNTIYEFTVKDFTDSIDVWQADSIERYIIKEYSSLATFSNDTTGFYFKRNGSLPESAKEFPSDTTIYINYTGKLLNGLVFDTTDEKIAKDNNIYSASKEYTPVRINWANSYSEITMGSSSSTVIQGFAMTLWRMRCAPDGGYWKDKCTGIFYSNLGYGYSGSGSSIPGYAPLIFEIEIVDEPKD